MKTRIKILACLILATIAATFAVRGLDGSGKTVVMVHRLHLGVCGWNSSASFGATWMTEPHYDAFSTYDLGTTDHPPST